MKYGRTASWRRVLVSEIVAAVSDVTAVPAAEICGPGRSRHLIEARFVTVLIISRLRPELSLSQVGRVLGGRDHSTIHSARARAAEIERVSPEFRRLVEAVMRRLGA